jgi:putative colanic acid biosynthesis glycosyltransferase
LVVIDGGSTDGTVDVIRKYDDVIDYWISEKDRGIAHAYAKGVRKAHGKWVYFLGSDDTFAAPDVFNAIAPHLTPEVEAVVGLVQRDTGSLFRSSIGLKTYFINTIHHQGAFYARTLFENFAYDEAIRVCEDYELNFLLAHNRSPVKFIDVVVSIWSTEGASSVSGEMRYYKNMYQMRSKYISPLVNCLFFLVGWANVVRRKLI